MSSAPREDGAAGSALSDGGAAFDVDREESFEKAENIELTERESASLGAALEDAVEQMSILRSRRVDSKAAKGDGDPEGPRAGPGGRPEAAEAVGDVRGAAKMKRDRDRASEILAEARLDLERNRSRAALTARLADVAAEAYRSVARELEHRQNRRRLGELERHRRKEAELNEAALRDCDLRICGLRDEIDDDSRNCDIEKAHLEASQSARREDGAAKIDRAERSLLESAAATKASVEREIETDGRVERFEREKTRELRREIEARTERYERESERIDGDAAIAEERREIQTQKTVALEKLLRERGAEIESWKSSVAEREERAERELLLRRSAVTVQAWWRGVSLRRRLAAKKTKDAKRKSAKRKK